MSHMEKSAPVRAAIYARLSAAQTGKDDGEQSDSIENQLADLRKLALSNGYTLTGEYVDDGVSGYSGKTRPRFQKLMLAIADGEVDIVLARHADRLERNEDEGYQLRLACTRHKVRWQYSSGMVVDPSTAEGGLLAKVLSALAEFESAVKTQRLLMHYEGLRVKGALQAPAGTFGYQGAEVVPWEADLVRRAYETVDDGGTIFSIFRSWNLDAYKGGPVPQRKKGALGWTHAHVRTILLRPRNARLVADRDGNLIRTEDGELLLGQWTEIVPVDLWMRVHAKLTDKERSPGPGFTPRILSGGIATCGMCGFKMRSNTAVDKRAGTRVKILRCSNPVRAKDENGKPVRHPSAHVDDLDAMIRQQVLYAFALGPSEAFKDDNAPDVLALEGELSRYRRNRQNVLDLLDEGVITKAEAALRLEKWAEPIRTTEERLKAATSASATAHMLVDLRAEFIDSETHRASFDGFGDLVAKLGERFDALPIKKRRDLVATLLDVEVHRGKGTQKYSIRHKVVTSLNDDGDEFASVD
jgi:site-specific DNA recombinase